MVDLLVPVARLAEALGCSELAQAQPPAVSVVLAVANRAPGVTLAPPTALLSQGAALAACSSEIPWGCCSLSLYASCGDTGASAATAGRLVLCATCGGLAVGVWWSRCAAASGAAPAPTGFCVACASSTDLLEQPLLSGQRDAVGGSAVAQVAQGPRGFRVCAGLVDERTLLVELLEAPAAPLAQVPNSELEALCARLAERCPAGGCVVGVRNQMLGNHLGNAVLVGDNGVALEGPEAVVEPGMGAPLLVGPRVALAGCSGCLAYDDCVGDTELVALAKWSAVPGAMLGPSRYNVHALPRQPATSELSRRMESDWVLTATGPLVRSEGGLTLSVAASEACGCPVFLVTVANY
eukprot:m51a1_g11434 hypothetical protein (352) ;mRNA; r:7112-13615